MSLIHLASRGVVRVAGPDALTFLNGLVTNDVESAYRNVSIYAAMLTPQGKFLYDMMIVSPSPNIFLLDVPRVSDFIKRLSMYKLRAQVTIEDMSEDLHVYQTFDEEPSPRGGHIAADPRLMELGHRMIIQDFWGDKEEVDYHAHCLELGVPDPARDLLVEKDFVMEGLFDEFEAIDFHKGCYVGQEMTSRMKRRTSVKNKLCRVRFEGGAPDFETPILADGWEVGRMRSGIEGVGIAMIRFDRARKAIDSGQVLMAGDVEITLDPPDWLVQPELT